MKKLFIALLWCFTPFVPANAQIIYDLVHEGSRRTIKNPTRSFMQKQLAQFAIAALVYLKIRMGDLENPDTEDALNTQAYFLSEFVNTYFHEVLHNGKNKKGNHGKLKEKFTKASLSTPLFKDADEDAATHINKEENLTPFSMNTDWEKAFKLISKKPHKKADDKEKLSLPKIKALREKLWAAWVDSVKSAENQELLSIEPLSPQMKSGRLEIPNNLEPNATMNYYWGHKDKEGDKNDSAMTYVYLHGSGPRDAEWKASIHWACRFDDAPANYFIPQIPNEGRYYRWWHVSKQWAWEWLWKQLMLTEGVDPNRIVVFGISEGGYGSQRLAAFYADYLAGAGPMAGGEPLINAPCENLQHIDFSLLTGEKDYMFCRNIYTGLAGYTLDSLRRENGGEGFNHRIGLIKGAGHGFDYSPTTPWLRQSIRNATPRHFTWEDFEMDGRHRKGFYNLKVDQRPCDSLRTRYDVNISPNGRIDLTIQNVNYIPLQKEPNWGLTLNWKKEYTPAKGGKLTIFLDERYLDLKEKVTVFINGKQVLSSHPEVSENVMKESLYIFADPERIFAGKLCINY